MVFNTSVDDEPDPGEGELDSLMDAAFELLD